MPRKNALVSESRKYLVTTVAQAKQITTKWLHEIGLHNAITLGLPEVDDRYHIWRVPLCNESSSIKIGEIVIDAYTTAILTDKTTKPAMLETRLLKKAVQTPLSAPSGSGISHITTAQYNRPGRLRGAHRGHACGICGLDFYFSYFNARPEYSEYEEYEQYLFKMRQVIKRAYRVLNDGRFFVMNTSPVLLRRASRNESSRRIAVPFDLPHIRGGRLRIH